MSCPHTCQANHCTWMAEARHLMCIHHWRLLPGYMQGAVQAAVEADRPGARNLTSLPYLEAAAEAVEFIATKEGRNTRNVFRELAKRLQTTKEAKTCP